MMLPPHESDRHAFLSYATLDSKWAQWIAGTIEEAGYSVAVVNRDLHPGHDFVQTTESAIAAASVAVLVVTPAYLGSAWTTAERHAVLARSDLATLVVTIGLQEPVPELATLPTVDLTDLDEDAASERLLGALPSPAITGAARRASASFPVSASRPAVTEGSAQRPHGLFGREDVLALLADQFGLPGSPSRTATLAIIGPAGIGKTSVARAFATIHQDAYDLIWWIDASDEEAARGGLLALADQLEPLARGSRKPDEAIRVARRWLETHARWLLVVDDATSAASLRQLLPRSASGHVLVTAREPDDWIDVAVPVRLGPLTVDSAAELLIARSGDEDPASARAIATALEGLPLALSLVVSQVQGEAGSLAAVRERLAASPLHTDTAMVQMALDDVRQDAPAFTVWQTIAFFAPEAIPASVVGRLLHLVHGDGARPEDLRATLRVLEDRSLIDVDPSGDLRVHAGLQEVVRDALPDNMRIAVVKLAQSAVLADVAEGGDVVESVMAHGLAIAGYARALDQEDVTTLYLLLRIGQTESAQGRLESARDVLTRAIQIADRLGDVMSGGIGMQALGMVLLDLSEPSEAQAAFESALVMHERAGNPKSAIADTLDSLAAALSAQGDLDRARQRAEQAIVIFEEDADSDPGRIALAVTHLGIIMRDQGELDLARSTLEGALATTERIYGAQSPRTAAILANLGIVLRRSGDAMGAAPLLQRSLDIIVDAYGPDNAQAGAALSNLGLTYLDLHDLSAARLAFERSIAVIEPLYGPQHPQTAATWTNIGVVRAAQGDLDGARSAFARGLEITEQIYGHEHARAVEIRRHLDELAEGRERLVDTASAGEAS